MRRPALPGTPPAARRFGVPAQLILWGLAAAYGYGALVHVVNMLSLSGFAWAAAPLKWRILDIAYLAIDLFVVVGLVRGWSSGIAAFFAAAGSQIVLYTLLRPWVLDVPDAFRRSAGEVAYLDGLVAFHAASCLAMIAALWLPRPARSDA